jgi:hypothetical protein
MQQKEENLPEEEQQKEDNRPQDAAFARRGAA